MLELETTIAAWRETMAAELPAETVRELEEHLREHIAAQCAEGVEPEAAFARAAERLGDTKALGREFARVGSRWFGGVHSREAQIMAIMAGVLGLVTWVAYVPWLYIVFKATRGAPSLGTYTLLYISLLIAFVVLGGAAISTSIRFLRAPTAGDGRILAAYNLLNLWTLSGYAMAWIGLSYWPAVVVVLTIFAALTLLWRRWSNHLNQTQTRSSEHD